MTTDAFGMYAVDVWQSVRDFAYSQPPFATILIVEADAEAAKDRARELFVTFEGFEAREAKDNDLLNGVPLGCVRSRFGC